MSNSISLNMIMVVVWLGCLFCGLVAADHCVTTTFNLNCGSDGCANGWWIGGTPHPSLVLTTGCTYTFNLANGGGNPLSITDINRVVVPGVAQHQTSGSVTWTPSSRGVYFYLNDNKEEYRAYITVVTDGVWSAWSGCCTPDCSASSSHTRTCSSPVSQTDFFGVVQNGDPCPGDSTMPCIVSSCNQVASWSAWSTTCTAPYNCGANGQQSRSCNGATACNGGCPGASTRTCDAGPCNGNWGGYGAACACGSGQTRTRTCNDPPPSNGGTNCPNCNGPGCPNVDTFNCPTTQCPGVPCGYQNTCPSCVCVPGSCTRIARCNCQPSESGNAPCTNHPDVVAPTCNYGNFGWSAWGTGNCTCTYPNQDTPCVNTRTCNRPTSTDCDPQVGVGFCQGAQTQRANTTRLCPPRYWTQWSGCSRPECTQGGGTRSRTCVNTGGAPCVGPSVEVCNNRSCDGQWSAWGTCTENCGGGRRWRNCIGAVNGGVNCTELGSPEQFIGACNTHNCGCILDMCFSLDGSGSIPIVSWGLLKAFSIEILSLINAGNGTEASIVQFSDSHRTVVEQQMTASLPVLTNKLASLVQQKGSTAIGMGIRLCEGQLERYNRPLIANVMLVITDGSQNDGPPAIQEAEKAKANGTEVFVIGVGGDVNYTELYNLASEPKEGVHLFNISDYNALLAIADQVTQGLCFGRPGAAAAANFYPFFALLALLPLGFGVFVIRRRKPKKKAPPPPPPKVEEPPPPPPTTRSASPKPITDKPKDWTVPGTRYIGFGQANIKVKWGTEAPPSAPRGHDKYDRWSMMAHPDGMKPGAPSSPKALDVEEANSTEGTGGPSSPLGGGAPRRIGCCERCFPCCCAPRALNQTKAKAGKGKKTVDDDEEADWQSNPAAN